MIIDIENQFLVFFEWPLKTGFTLVYFTGRIFTINYAFVERINCLDRLEGYYNVMGLKVSEYDQEMTQSLTTDQTMAPRGRVTDRHPEDNKC